VAVFVTNPVISNTRRYQKHFRNLVGMIFINRRIQENQKKNNIPCICHWHFLWYKLKLYWES